MIRCIRCIIHRHMLVLFVYVDREQGVICYRLVATIEGIYEVGEKKKSDVVRFRRRVEICVCKWRFVSCRNYDATRSVR